MKANQWTPVGDRVWSRIQKSEGCWEWIGPRHRSGYGRLRLDGRVTNAHRVVWQLLYGTIPDGLFVCHRCDNPPCCRPDHLFLGTAGDNTRDMVSKGHQGPRRGVSPERASRGDAHWTRKHPENVTRGERVNRAKLTPEQVMEIRHRYAAGESSPTLARAFGVTHENVLAIVKGKSWAHLPTVDPKPVPTAAELRDARRRSGKTLLQVATAVGVRESAISRWETGSRRLTAAHRDALLEALGLS